MQPTNLFVQEGAGFPVCRPGGHTQDWPRLQSVTLPEEGRAPPYLALHHHLPQLDQGRPTCADLLQLQVQDWLPQLLLDQDSQAAEEEDGEQQRIQADLPVPNS